MNRINHKGMELLEYKKELMKEYPPLIKSSLILALEQMTENKVVDMDTYLVIKNEETSIDTFHQYLLKKSTFTKTPEEVYEEFEVLRKKLDGYFEEKGISDLQSESVIDKDVILVSRKFTMDQAFTMNYFGVEEKDLLKLMKRRGFVEKFAVLRLMKIFKEWLKYATYKESLIVPNISLVYFDSEEYGYSIDVTFEISIEEIEKEQLLEDITLEITRLKGEAEAFYESKIIS